MCCWEWTSTRSTRSPRRSPGRAAVTRVERRALRLRRRPGRTGGVHLQRAAVRRTTTCSTASSACATRAASTTCASAAGCAPTWTRSPSARCASSIIEPIEEVRLVLAPNRFGISLDLTCHTGTVAVHGPGRDHARRRAADQRAGDVRAGSASARAEVRVGGDRIELTAANASFFRNHSWGMQPGRGGPRPYGAPRPSGAPAGVRQWVLFDMPRPRRLLLRGPQRSRASGKGAILYADRSVPGGRRAARADVLRRRPAAARGGSSSPTSRAHSATYEFTDLGWVYCQGGGYFGGFDDGLGQGVLPRRLPRGGRGVGRQPSHRHRRCIGTHVPCSSTTGRRASRCCAMATQSDWPTTSAS